MDAEGGPRRGGPVTKLTSWTAALRKGSSLIMPAPENGTDSNDSPKAVSIARRVSIGGLDLAKGPLGMAQRPSTGTTGAVSFKGLAHANSNGGLAISLAGLAQNGLAGKEPNTMTSGVLSTRTQSVIHTGLLAPGANNGTAAEVVTAVKDLRKRSILFTATSQTGPSLQARVGSLSTYFYAPNPNPGKGVCFSPDGTYVMRWGYGTDVKLLSADDGCLVMTLFGPTPGAVRFATFNNDGSRVAAATDDCKVYVWITSNKHLLCAIDVGAEPLAHLVFSHDSKTILSCDDEGQLELWSISQGVMIRRYEPGHNSRRCGFSKDGSSVLSCAGDDCGLTLLDTLTGEVQLAEAFEEITEARNRAAYIISPDGTKVLLYLQEQVYGINLIVYNTSSESCIRLQVCDGAVTHADFSNDSSLFVTAGRDDAIHVWDSETGILTGTLEGHSSDVMFCKISQDGHVAVSGDSEGSVLVWALESGMCVMRLQSHFSPVAYVDINANGTRALTVDSEGHTFLWYLDSARMFEVLKFQSDLVCSVLPTPDGGSLVVGYKDGSLRKWNVGDGPGFAAGVTWAHQKQGCPVELLAMRPDGSHVASAGRDGTVLVTDLRRGVVVAILARHADFVTSLLYSPRGDQLVTATRVGEVCIWDARSYGSEPLHALEVPELFEVSSLAMSPTQSLLAAATAAGTVHVWSTTAYTLLADVKVTELPATRITFNSDGSVLAVGSADGGITLVDPLSGMRAAHYAGNASGIKELTFLKRPDHMLLSLCGRQAITWDCRKSAHDHVANFIADGSRIFMGENMGAFGTRTAVAHSAAVLYDPINHAAMYDMQPRPPEEHPGNSYLFREGTALTDGLNGLPMALFCAPDTTVRMMADEQSGTRCLDFSSDGRLMVSGTLRGEVVIWDVVHQQQLKKWTAHKRYAVTCVKFTHDSTAVYSCAEDCKVIMWDWRSQTKLATLAGHQAPVASVDMSVDGTHMASGDKDGFIFIWDSTTHAPKQVIPAHNDAVLCCSLSPCGTMVASTGADEHIVILDVHTGEQIAMLDDAMDGQGLTIKFSFDGTRLQVGGEKGSILIWDVARNCLLYDIPAHDGKVFDCGWSGDSRRLLSVGSDGKARLWDAAAGSELCQANFERVMGAVESGGFVRCDLSATGNRMAGCTAKGQLIDWDVGAELRCVPEGSMLYAWLSSLSLGRSREVYARLLRQFPLLPNTQDSRGRTILMHAVANSNPEITKLIISSVPTGSAKLGLTASIVQNSVLSSIRHVPRIKMLTSPAGAASKGAVPSSKRSTEQGDNAMPSSPRRVSRMGGRTSTSGAKSGTGDGVKAQGGGSGSGSDENDVTAMSPKGDDGGAGKTLLGRVGTLFRGGEPRTSVSKDRTSATGEAALAIPGLTVMSHVSAQPSRDDPSALNRSGPAAEGAAASPTAAGVWRTSPPSPGSISAAATWGATAAGGNPASVVWRGVVPSTGSTPLDSDSDRTSPQGPVTSPSNVVGSSNGPRSPSPLGPRSTPRLTGETGTVSSLSDMTALTGPRMSILKGGSGDRHHSASSAMLPTSLLIPPAAAVPSSSATLPSPLGGAHAYVRRSLLGSVLEAEREGSGRNRRRSFMFGSAAQAVAASSPPASHRGSVNGATMGSPRAGASGGSVHGGSAFAAAAQTNLGRTIRYAMHKLAHVGSGPAGAGASTHRAADVEDGMGEDGLIVRHVSDLSRSNWHDEDQEAKALQAKLDAAAANRGSGNKVWPEPVASPRVEPNALRIALEAGAADCVQHVLDAVLDQKVTPGSYHAISAAIAAVAQQYPTMCEAFLSGLPLRPLGEMEVPSAVAARGMVVTSAPSYTSYKEMWTHELQLEGYEKGPMALMEACMVRLPFAAASGKASVLHTLVESDVPVQTFGCDTVKAIVDYKWRSFAQRRIYVKALVYLLFTITFTVFAVLFADDDNTADIHDLYDQPRGVAIVIFAAVLFMYGVYFLVLECIQLFSLGAAAYFDSFWNLVDIAAYVTTLVVCPCTVFRFGIGRGQFVAVLIAAETIMLWIKVLFYGLAIDGVGTFIFMTAEIIKGLKYFIGLLATLFISFAVAFMVLFRNEPAVASDGSDGLGSMYGDFGNALLNVYLVMFSITDPSIVKNSEYSHFAILLMCVYMFALLVVLLNMLITLMADIYAKVKGIQHFVFLKGRAELIIDVESTTGAGPVNCDNHPYLHLLMPLRKDSNGSGGAADGAEGAKLDKMVTAAVARAVAAKTSGTAGGDGGAGGGLTPRALSTNGGGGQRNGATDAMSGSASDDDERSVMGGRAPLSRMQSGRSARSMMFGAGAMTTTGRRSEAFNAPIGGATMVRRVGMGGTGGGVDAAQMERLERNVARLSANMEAMMTHMRLRRASNSGGAAALMTADLAAMSPPLARRGPAGGGTGRSSTNGVGAMSMAVRAPAGRDRPGAFLMASSDSLAASQAHMGPTFTGYTSRIVSRSNSRPGSGHAYGQPPPPLSLAPLTMPTAVPMGILHSATSALAASPPHHHATFADEMSNPLAQVLTDIEHVGPAPRRASVGPIGPSGMRTSYTGTGAGGLAPPSSASGGRRMSNSGTSGPAGPSPPPSAGWPAAGGLTGVTPAGGAKSRMFSSDVTSTIMESAEEEEQDEVEAAVAELEQMGTSRGPSVASGSVAGMGAPLTAAPAGTGGGLVTLTSTPRPSSSSSGGGVSTRGSVSGGVVLPGTSAMVLAPYLSGSSITAGARPGSVTALGNMSDRSVTPSGRAASPANGGGVVAAARLVLDPEEPGTRASSATGSMPASGSGTARGSTVGIPDQPRLRTPGEVDIGVSE